MIADPQRALVLLAMIAVKTDLLKAGKRCFIALAVQLCFSFVVLPVCAAAAAALEEATNTNLSIALSRERVQWGEEVEIVVSAVNSTGMTLSGGIYVSFDDEVLMLDVKGGNILRPGASAYNLAASTSKPIGRPMAELWEDNWKPGIERKVTLLVMPLARDRIRVLARATFVNPGSPPKIWISPGRTESRSLDETAFPTNVGYVLISRQASLRRTFRRFERRMRELNDAEQSRFAAALAGMLEDPKALKGLFADESTAALSQSLQIVAPRIADQLRRDAPVALDNMRCLMVDLGCRRALVYFGVPLAVYAEFSAEEVARLDAKVQISNEKGGSELVALLEAEGVSYRRDRSNGGIEIKLNGASARVESGRPVVKELLERIIVLLGPAAQKIHPEANGMSFTRLQSQLLGGN